MKTWSDFFLHNLGLKIVSVLLAFLLWLTFAAPEPVQRMLSLPVEFVNMPSQLEISDEYDKQVEVVILSERSISSIEERELTVLVDLEGVNSGTELIPLTDGNIRNKPSGVEVLSMSPPRILLQLESTLFRIVNVTPELAGTPGEGFEVVSTEVQPAEVRIGGPESSVRTVSAVKTEPIQVEGRVSTFKTKAYIDLEDSRLRIEDTTSVDVAVNIEEERREITVQSVPINVFPEGSQVRMSRSRLNIIGTVPLSFSGELKASDFKVVVDVESFEPRPEPYALVPQVRVSEQYGQLFRVESMVPEQLNVRRIR